MSYHVHVQKKKKVINVPIFDLVFPKLLLFIKAKIKKMQGNGEFLVCAFGIFATN